MYLLCIFIDYRNIIMYHTINFFLCVSYFQYADFKFLRNSTDFKVEQQSFFLFSLIGKFSLHRIEAVRKSIIGGLFCASLVFSRLLKSNSLARHPCLR